MEAQGGEGEEGDNDPENEVRGDHENDEEINQGDGCERVRDECADVLITAEATDDDGEDEDKKSERDDGRGRYLEKEGTREKEDGSTEAKDWEAFGDVADWILGGLGAGGEGDAENVASEAEGEDGEDGPSLGAELAELLPGDKGEGCEGVDEGAGSSHEEEAGGVDLVPLGICENADDDACGEEGRDGSNEGAKNESRCHEDDGKD